MGLFLIFAHQTPCALLWDSCSSLAGYIVLIYAPDVALW